MSGTAGSGRETAAEIARGLVALCREGRFAEAGQTYWDDAIVSIEAAAPPGMDRAAHGRAAVVAKGEGWAAMHEVRSCVVEGPWTNGEQFVVRFIMEMIVRATGETRTMDETALYTTREGAIVEERFFYGA